VRGGRELCLGQGRRDSPWRGVSTRTALQITYKVPQPFSCSPSPTHLAAASSCASTARERACSIATRVPRSAASSCPADGSSRPSSALLAQTTSLSTAVPGACRPSVPAAATAAAASWAGPSNDRRAEGLLRHRTGDSAGAPSTPPAQLPLPPRAGASAPLTRPASYAPPAPALATLSALTGVRGPPSPGGPLRGGVCKDRGPFSCCNGVLKPSSPRWLQSAALLRGERPWGAPLGVT
jgi:hypothetical protein